MDDHSSKKRRRRLGRLEGVLPVAIVVGTALGAAACGGNAATPKVASIGSVTTTTGGIGTAASDGQSNLQQAYQAQLAYSQCMRSHGVVNFPDPVLTSHNISFGAGRNINQKSTRFITASTTCKRLVPDGGPPSAAQMQEAIARLLKNAECMRAHGVANFPDPVTLGGGVGISLKGLDPNSPGFQAAQKICNKLAPLGGIG